jgi:hypothetical protein
VNEQSKMSTTPERTVCQTCGHVIAKPRKGLSSVLYRQIVRDITTRDSLRNVKGKLVQIIQQGCSADLTREFAQNLDKIIGADIPVEIPKKWLLEQLAILGKDSGELPLYKFLSDKYFETGIDEPFTTFYEAYTQWIENSLEPGSLPETSENGLEPEGPMTKNFVSRALGAIGLKAKMVRIDFEGRKKSAMVLKASGDELHQLLQDFINTSN